MVKFRNVYPFFKLLVYMILINILFVLCLKKVKLFGCIKLTISCQKKLIRVFMFGAQYIDLKKKQINRCNDLAMIFILNRNIKKC